MIRVFVIAALAAATAACSNEPADEDTEGFSPPVVEARGDFEQRQERRFRRLDADSDGVLAVSELPRRRPERVGRLDTSKDGLVSRNEFMTGRLARFDAMDKNGDREVTPEERRAAPTD